MDITNQSNNIKITPKERKIVNEKIKGKTDRQIGAIVYPNAKPESARVQVTTQLKKSHVAQYLEQSKLQALKEHNITWSRIISPISEALTATKTDHITGEISTDHTTRLKASKQAIELLQARSQDEVTSAPQINLPSNIDELELQRLIFKAK